MSSEASHDYTMRDFLDEAWFEDKEFTFEELGELFLALENVCDTLYVDSEDESECDRLKMASLCSSVAYYVLDGGEIEGWKDILNVTGLLHASLGRYLDENRPKRG